VDAVAAVDAVDEPRIDLGIGIGWRAEIDLTVERLPGVDFVEVIAEHVNPRRPPESLLVLRGQGMPVLPHGVGLNLGGADKPDRGRLRHLAALAEAFDSPFVSDHIAFVRADGLESGHLLPIARTQDALDVVCANIDLAQAALPVPLAVENIAALIDWPQPEMSEAQFIRRIVERTGIRLVLDIANLYANERNLALGAVEALDELPLDHVAYLHVAGGVEAGGLYHDTHTSAPSQAVMDLLAETCRRIAPPGVLLEYDDCYPADAQLAAELAAIRSVLTHAAA
jgi:uncharacterized protein (UPF0276 family)